MSNNYAVSLQDDQWTNVDSTQQQESFVDGLVISILVITAITNSAYAIIAPFLPFEFKKKQIDQDWIGYIFAMYSVAVIICSPFVGSMV